MQPISKKLKITALIVFVIAYLIIAVIAFGRYFLWSLMSDAGRANMLLQRSEVLAILKPVIIFAPGYAIVSAAVFHFWRVPLLNRIRQHDNRILLMPEAFLLWIIHSFLVLPAIGGLLLSYTGLPVNDFIVFFLVSFMLTLVWSIYDLRTNSWVAIDNSPSA
jgi:hypothetical protein